MQPGAGSLQRSHALQPSSTLTTAFITLAVALCDPYPATAPVQAFLAGVAVGLQLPAAGRRRTALHPVLLGVVLVSALVVLAGSALLPAGCAQARPTTVYYT